MLLILNKVVLTLTVFTVLSLPCLTSAAKYALIIACRAGNGELQRKNQLSCSKLSTILRKKNFKDIIIFFPGGERELKESREVNRLAIIATLHKLSRELKSKDQLWLFLLGHASATPRRVSLATKGGRLTGRQLAALLDNIKAEQFIFCLNTRSHGLMPLLAKNDRLVVCATDSYNQLNPPRFTKLFIDSWHNNPDGRIVDIVREAGNLTEQFYKSNNLAAAENSQLYYKGRIVSYPFNGSGIEWLNFDQPGRSTAEHDQAKNRFQPTPKGLKLHPATSASRAELMKARQLGKKYLQYAAVYVKRHIALTLRADKSYSIISTEAIYLNRDAGAELFGQFEVPVVAGSTGKIMQATIIYPNASYTDFKTLTKKFDKSIIFSGLRRGCLLLRSAMVNLPASSQLPDFNQELLLQKAFPVAATRIKLNIAQNSQMRYKLYNAQAKPQVVTTEYGKTYTFKLGPISAYSPLPDDPDRQQLLSRLALSTMPSWKSFAAWTKRMLKHSAEVDAKAKQLLDKIVAGAKTDTDKVKKLYDFLVKLRYVTVPIGAAAFRPRPPGMVMRSRYGDCKDKANALVVLAAQLGINGYRLLLNRYHQIDQNFPAWQFNHMLVYFPKLSGYPDGLWLDATDSGTRFGTLPPGDVGRIGLLLKDQSIEFRRVTSSGKVINSIERDINLSFDSAAGGFTGKIRLVVNGLPEYKMRRQLKLLSPRQLKFFMQKMVATFLPDFTVKNITIATALTDMSKPLTIIIAVQGQTWALNLYTDGLTKQLWPHFLLPQRRYGIVINDRQSLWVKQRLTVTGLTVAAGKKVDFNQQAGGLAIKFSSEQTTQLKQTFEYKLKSGPFSALDYRQARDELLSFKQFIYSKCSDKIPVGDF